MDIAAITPCLTALFGENLTANGPEHWVVDRGNQQLLLLLSEDQSWVRLMVSIAPAADAQPYLGELLTANFDRTQEARYALSEGILWGMFQHSRDSLTEDDLKQAIARLVQMQDAGLNDIFQSMAEKQVRQIIWASKKQGQTLDATLKTLERFYAEGMLGGVEQPKEERDRFLQAWRQQLERLWDEVEV